MPLQKMRKRPRNGGSLVENMPSLSALYGGFRPRRILDYNDVTTHEGLNTSAVRQTRAARFGRREMLSGMAVVATADVATWLVACFVRPTVLEVQLVVFSLQLYKVEVAVRFYGDAFVLERLKLGAP